MCRRIEQRFKSRPESVGAVRRFLSTTLEVWGLDDQDAASPAAQSIVLVASELSTNSVQAASGDFCVALTVHRNYAEVSVEDEAPQAARKAPAQPDRIGGRGLAIVAALSSRWGQDPYDGAHKKVWSRIPVPPGSALGRQCRL